ncbi:MAG TPA: ABC transporter permease [Pyrinomonadaceae bacterium]|nr:ABC transporter permease [Pyrinomonadaceae bacterium]
MDNLISDVRQGIRGLLRQPGLSLVAITTLALGIGINAALFSVVNSVLLNPLPFSDPNQLVTIDQSKPNFDLGAIPYPNFLDMRKQNQTFTAMTIQRATAFSLIGSGEPERVNGRYVSSDFCAVFDVKPIVGRCFAPGEDERGWAPVVLITNDLWQRKFGGNYDVLHKGITLDAKSYSIIGVLPATFKLFRTSDVYVPIGQWNNQALQVRSAGLNLHAMGRLKPGVTIEQGEADLNRIMQSLAVTYPDTNRNNGAKVSSLKERVIGNIGPTLWMLLGAVGFVLLIACVNVGNLLLARSTGRSRDFAIRAALGAGRWRLLRQTLTESLLLALIGGALGLLVASWATNLAITVLPTTLPRANEVHLEGRVLIFAFAVTVFSGLLAGIAPALKNSSWHLASALKEGGRGATGRGRAQGVLVATEMALAVVLLIGGGLMVRSLRALWSVDPGFRPENVVSFGVSLAPETRTKSPQEIRSNIRQLSDQLNATPGVRAASLSLGASPMGSEDDLSFWLEGQPKPASQSEMHMSLVYRVEPTYLKVMSIPLKRGRFFSNQDDERSTPVVVIDEVFAEKFFGQTDPIGKRIVQDGQDPQTIIGIVGHTKQWGLDSDDSQSVRAQLYEAIRQFPDNAMGGLAPGAEVVALTDGPGAAQVDAIRRTVRNHHNANVVFSAQTMNEVIAQTLAPQQFMMILLDSFAAIALVLASIGLYGVISYLVGQRTHELGIRIALGAQRQNVLRLVLGQGLKVAAVGIGVGLLAAFGLTRLLSNMLYGVSTTDPPTFLAITGILLIVAVLASLLPAWRATRVDPLVALRNE